MQDVKTVKRGLYLKRLDRFLEQTKWALNSQKLYYKQMIYKVESIIDILEKFLQSVKQHQKYIQSASIFIPQCNSQLIKLHQFIKEIYKRYYEIEADLFEYECTYNTFHSQQFQYKTKTFECIVTNHCNEEIITKKYEFDLPDIPLSFQTLTDFPLTKDFLLSNPNDLIKHQIEKQNNEYFEPQLNFVKIISTSRYIVGDQANHTVKMIEFDRSQNPEIIRSCGNLIDNHIACDIAICHDKYYSADKGSNTISYYDSNLKRTLDFGGFGSESGKFNEPTSIEIKKNRLFVCDSLNHRIQQFDLQGRYEKSITEHMLYPSCVRMNYKDQLLIVDEWKSKVIIIDAKTGKEVDVLGNKIEEDKFLRPTHLACFNDEVYVSDTGNGRILQFKNNQYSGQLKLKDIGIDGNPLGIDAFEGEIAFTVVGNNQVFFIKISCFETK
ncbi:NHL repeat containing protein [Entamoeba histolytica HM-1:IMSS-B]|uniref:NHL repeat protein n=6 Tax=Entamoeba histolytica TaxID=5759 RepID=C4M8Y4_ENTH1|nr:hypothetical protein EHI_086360 [Entamoeba histolytica HM-1:IMSS]EMD45748.1 NHL repeatcontaining protein [Entamoeba histolytica KU27]EMH76157.1 NHL repeat containing protein [Entamoeba histolytica HM-1:IMSS-B]EMS15119.1 NHL repeat-containing protein [Entamoeba histolytica HM-3:IMSS]ENY62565.1 NHL repeat-containing protein [Entamoeba histolytica HM-1:IMSS-A]GAT98087.1 hypothetical protein CL6EHI_086360 [Entamoeba histolytica]|eukprot:XP_649561.1 hypothetical protein EHI_086360 [Entamoeba histolytica HM-1:IMSS]